MNDLILIGGGGHCKSCIDVIETEKKYNIIGILDKTENIGNKILGCKVIGSDRDILNYIADGCFFLITIGHLGNRESRTRLYDFLKVNKAKIATIISPTAYVAKSAIICPGTIVMHGVIVNALAEIEENCIINTRAIIEHDSLVEAHSHISTGAIINGGVKVAQGTFFGSNSVSKQGVETLKDDFIKAGVCFSGHKPKVALLTTIFEMDNEIIHDFFSSLCIQTYKEFVLIVLNDGFKCFEKVKNKYSSLKIIEIPAADSIAKNRQCLVNYAMMNNYDMAVFGDIDDYFSENRISTVVRLLKNTDIVVNDLTAFNKKGTLQERIFSNRVKDLQEITAEFVLEKNIFGMTNTAVNLNILSKKEVCFPSDLIAVDWYFFSRLLSRGARAVFTNQAISYYRQHESNTVGIGYSTRDSIDLAIKVKLNHYLNMSIDFPEYVVLSEKVALFKYELNHNENFSSHIEFKNKNSSSLLWWELEG
jgi:sugar O-acyltransferase (sialic acid O-acetyltransferase NeuD family)